MKFRNVHAVVSRKLKLVWFLVPWNGCDCRVGFSDGDLFVVISYRPIFIAFPMFLLPSLRNGGENNEMTSSQVAEWS